MPDTSSRPKPTQKQLAWQDLEFGMFCHFGPNTFLDQEWGTGAEDPDVFNPTALDPKQWAQVAKEAGMRYLVFTAKHHDGFCLWPTETTSHSVRSSSWAGGKGDVVGMVAEACREVGLKLGLYCSPWDRHEPAYNDPPAYDRLYTRQWTELLTRYGPLVCVWLDGAGSEGHVYNWEMIIGTIRELRPDACIFSMGEPDYRWVGNEDGLAPDPCWNVVEAPEPGQEAFLLPAFAAGYPHWMPAECDARLRANWFWNTYDLPTLKSVERLVDMYCKSVGHGANLLLNVGPDSRGLLPEPDVERLFEMAREIRRRFGHPLAKAHGPASALEVRFDTATAVNCAISQENIAEGEKVREYILQALIHGRWEGVCVGTAIGHKKIDYFPTVVADGLRLQVTRSDGTPSLRSLEVFHS